jgi:hypothetical protein
MKMKVLLVGQKNHGALELSYFSAFRKLQCDVVHFDTELEYRRLAGLNGNTFLKKAASSAAGSYFRRVMNDRLLQAASAFQPDLILVFKGVTIFAQTLGKLKENTHAVLFNFNPDNPFNPPNSSRHLLDSLPVYDCLFIWGKFLMSDLRQTGARRVEYLPFAHDPELHHPVPVTDNEREKYGSDIAFIGTWEREREDWLENLADYDLKIWGNSWNKLGRTSPLRLKWMGKPVFGEEFAKICGSAKIVLNFIRAQNGDAHNMRTFEVPACRGFLLTERTQEQQEFFEEGKQIAGFKDVGELRNQVDRYLSDEENRQSLARAASINVLQHTYEMRTKKILDILNDYFN